MAFACARKEGGLASHAEILLISRGPLAGKEIKKVMLAVTFFFDSWKGVNDLVSFELFMSNLSHSTFPDAEGLCLEGGMQASVIESVPEALQFVSEEPEALEFSMSFLWGS